MNQANDFLFQLIHSLEKGELQYFRRRTWVNLKSGRNTSLGLFEAILAQGTWDEAVLITKCSSFLKPKNYSAAKTRLMELILKSLRSYKESGNAKPQLAQRIEEILILREKRLDQLAERKSIQALRIAKNLEQWDHQIELHHILIQLDLQKKSKKMLADIQVRQHSISECRTKLNQEADFKSIYEQILAFGISSNRISRDTQNGRMESLLVKCKGLGVPASLLSRVFKAEIEGRVEFIAGNFKKALDIYLRENPAWIEIPVFIQRNRELYLKFQFQLLTCCIQTKSPSEMVKNLIKVRIQIEQMPGNKTQFMKKVLFMDLLYCMNFGDLKRGETLLSEIRIWMDKNLNPDFSSSILAFSYNCAIFQFLLGRFKESLNYINNILFLGKGDSYQGIRQFVLLFQLVIHYELGNMDVIDFRIRSVKRDLSKTENRKKYELCLLLFFQQIGLAPGPSQKRELFLRLKVELETLVEKSSSRVPVGHFELLFWIQSNLESRGIRELYQEALENRGAS